MIRKCAKHYSFIRSKRLGRLFTPPTMALPGLNLFRHWHGRLFSGKAPEPRRFAHTLVNSAPKRRICAE